MSNLLLNLKDEIHQKLKEVSSREGLTVTDWIRRAIMRYLNLPPEERAKEIHYPKWWPDVESAFQLIQRGLISGQPKQEILLDPSIIYMKFNSWRVTKRTFGIVCSLLLQQDIESIYEIAKDVVPIGDKHSEIEVQGVKMKFGRPINQTKMQEAISRIKKKIETEGA